MLKPEVSLPVAAATSALVYGLYSNATPTIADIRTGAPQDGDIEAARKMAAWSSAAVVAAVSLIARDPTIFVIGGGAVILLDWWTRHANAVKPETGKAAGGLMSGSPETATGYYQPEDGADDYIAE